MITFSGICLISSPRSSSSSANSRSSISFCCNASDSCFGRRSERRIGKNDVNLVCWLWLSFWVCFWVLFCGCFSVLFWTSFFATILLVDDGLLTPFVCSEVPFFVLTDCLKFNFINCDYYFEINWKAGPFFYIKINLFSSSLLCNIL